MSDELDYVPVEGHPGLVRHAKSGAILNVNRTAIETAKEAKRQRRKKEGQNQVLLDRVSKLEIEVENLKHIINLFTHAIYNSKE